MPTFEEMASWAEKYEIHGNVSECCMIGMLQSLTRLPEGMAGPWDAELTALDERDGSGEDVAEEVAELCRRIVEFFPWLRPHILRYAARIQGAAEFQLDASFWDNGLCLKGIFDEIVTNLLNLEKVRAVELLTPPQPSSHDFLLRLTSWEGEVIRISLKTSFDQAEEQDFDKNLALQAATGRRLDEKPGRSFDKGMWFGEQAQ